MYHMSEHADWAGSQDNKSLRNLANPVYPAFMHGLDSCCNREVILPPPPPEPLAVQALK